MTVPPHQMLTLYPLAGPDVPPIEVTAGKPVVIGRSSACEVRLSDDAVSRRHAQITSGASTSPSSAAGQAVVTQAAEWFVTDLGSRHGTYLNAVRLAAEQAAPLRDGDLLRIGPWTFRVTSGRGNRQARTTTNDLGNTIGGPRVERVLPQELANLARQRLDLLIEFAGAVNAAGDEKALADAALDAVIKGTGFPRAALIRSIGADQVDIIGFKSIEQVGSGDSAARPTFTESMELSFSRSLIKGAAAGQVVRLMQDAPQANYGQSIVSLGIHSALCAPVYLGPSIDAYLYLDARRAERSVQPDAAAFCEAVARVSGMALANIKARELADRERRLIADLDAARAAQQLLLPPERGEHGPLRYAMRMKSGRLVAGDLFDVIPLDSGRVAVFLGDVAGKGASAGMLMATAQAHLNAELRTTRDPAQAASSLNKLLAAKAARDRFISLWIGLFDPAQRTLIFVDAGHGYWLLREPGKDPRTVSAEGGLVLGVDPDSVYVNEYTEIAAGTRIAVFSDGVVEQTSPEGQQFGIEGAINAIRAAANADEDAARLFDAVLAHAQGTPLGDDTTVASIECWE
ncbi:MAG: SpoIIE family protein phosphatase [Phycisphaerales bacterium]|nr:SpoIIE family protein phosphatase [Phycisphaerales bacterium]